MLNPSDAIKTNSTVGYVRETVHRGVDVILEANYSVQRLATTCTYGPFYWKMTSPTEDCDPSVT